jgi:hypothetical protein
MTQSKNVDHLPLLIVGISPQKIQPSKAFGRRESNFAQTETRRNLFAFDLSIDELIDTQTSRELNQGLHEMQLLS